MISGDLINMLDLLPNKELREVQDYIYNLKVKRKQELAKEYIEKFNTLFKEIKEQNFDEIYINTGDDEITLELWHENIKVTEID